MLAFSKYKYLVLAFLIFLLWCRKSMAQETDLILEKHQEIIELFQNQPDSAIAVSTRLLPLVSELRSDSLLAKTHYYIAVAYYYKGFYHMSNIHYQKALETDFGKQNLILISKCKNNMGINYDLLEEYPAAIDNYLASMNIDLRLGDTLGANFTKVNIGLLYSNIRQQEAAFNILQEALDFFTLKNHIYGQALANQNLGKILIDRKKFDEAWPYLIRAKNLYIKSNDIYELGMVLISLTSCANELDRFGDAERFIDSAISIAMTGGFDYLNTRAQLSKANMLLHQSKYKAAKSIVDTLKTNNIRTEKNRLRILVEVSAALHDPEQFNYAFSRFMSIQDSVLETQSNHLINELHIQYETDKKTELLESQKKLITAYRRQILLAGVGISLILLLTGIILFYYFKLKKSNRTLFEKNLELAQNYQLKRLGISNESDQESFSNIAGSHQPDKLWKDILKILKEDKAYINPSFSLEDLARACNSNKTYITKEIKQNTTSNFKTLVNRFRTEEARQLLEENTNFSMDAIAKQAGFNSISSFYRVFKNYTGLTPIQYQQHKKVD